MDEIWKDIPGYEGLYQASSLGNIKSLARIEKRKDGTRNPIRERILKPSINPSGYYFLNVSKNGVRKNSRVHRLVGKAFLPPDTGLEINHINGIKTDNRIENLEWVTHSENGKHAYRIGIHAKIIGEAHPSSKITNAQAEEIRAKYIPFKYTMKMLSREYGIDDSIISGIITGKRYASR